MPKQLIKHNLGTSPAVDNMNVGNPSPQPRVASSYPSRQVSAASIGPEQGPVPVSRTKVNLSRSAASSPAE